MGGQPSRFAPLEPAGASGTRDHPPYTSTTSLACSSPPATRATISPPGPDCGALTTHWVKAAASAASTAEPPARRASIPASVASLCPLATPADPLTDSATRILPPTRSAV